MEEVADKLAKERIAWQSFREELVAQVDSVNGKYVSEKKTVSYSCPTGVRSIHQSRV